MKEWICKTRQPLVRGLSFWLFVCLLSCGVVLTGCTPSPQQEVPSEQQTEPTPEVLTDASDAAPPERRVPTPPPITEIKKPDKIEPLKLDLSKYELPKELAGDPTLVVEGSKSTGFLAGGKAGLYQLNSQGKFELLDKGVVVSLVLFQPANKQSPFLFVVRPKEIQIWEGALRSSGIHSNFDGDEITGMVSRDKDEVWIGTRTKLWRLKGQDLGVVEGVKGVKWLATSTGSNSLIVQDQLGVFYGLRSADKGASWSSQNLSDEGKPFERVIPLLDTRFWGLVQGNLYQRIETKDKAGWWPYRIQPDKKNNNAELQKIQSIQLDPSNGLTWALTDGDLFRLQGSIAMKLTRPKELKKITAAWISQDGLLWLADGTTLVRLGNKEAALTYAKDVQPFLTQNCNRCHAGDTKTARPLETFDQIVKELSAMITSVENGNMPLDKKPLQAGDKGLLRRWRDQGMKK